MKKADLKKNALTYWYYILTDKRPEFLDPKSLSKGDILFREGHAHCDSCAEKF